jgi:hypothetical protein
VFSVSVDSVSMSLVLRGAKKLRIITVLLGSLPAADFGADVSLENCVVFYHCRFI